MLVSEKDGTEIEVFRSEVTELTLNVTIKYSQQDA
jgi:hypothetical protein